MVDVTKTIRNHRGLLYRAVRRVRNILLPKLSTKIIFTRIYQNNTWADPESVSGRGSTLGRTESLRRALPQLLHDVQAKSLLDAGCGDFNWMQHVDLHGIKYIGIEVVEELVARNERAHAAAGRSFYNLDITNDLLPTVDVILCRDCFIHLSFKHIHAAVANFKKSKSTFLLATTHAGVAENRDIRSGDWRSINLQLPPFNFPSSVCLLEEDAEGKYLAMWRLADL